MNTEIITDGLSLNTAQKALIMIHRRGAGAHDILSIAKHLKVADFALAAPQAENRTWYPYSFLVPIEENEPYFSKSLDAIHQVVVAIQKKRISIFLDFRRELVWLWNLQQEMQQNMAVL